MIEFFDPYGLMPDMELKFAPSEFRDKVDENYPYLTDLLVKAGDKVEYNQHEFQKEAKGISTCGRHTACRLYFREWPLKKFIKMFGYHNKTYDSDDLVTIWSEFRKKKIDSLSSLKHKSNNG
jgi:hypothetical protein